MALINSGKVWAFGKLSELYDKYAIGIIRVSTDSPEEVAAEVRKLKYVKDLRTDIRGISVRVAEGKRMNFTMMSPSWQRRLRLKFWG